MSSAFEHTLPLPLTPPPLGSLDRSRSVCHDVTCSLPTTPDPVRPLQLVAPSAKAENPRNYSIDYRKRNKSCITRMSAKQTRRGFSNIHTAVHISRGVLTLPFARCAERRKGVFGDETSRPLKYSRETKQAQIHTQYKTGIRRSVTYKTVNNIQQSPSGPEIQKKTDRLASAAHLPPPPPSACHNKPIAGWGPLQHSHN